MALFDQKTKDQLKQLFSKMVKPIKIHFWTQDIECPSCLMNHQFLEEISSLSDKIKLFEHDFVKEKDLAHKYNIDKIPSILITDENESILGVRFFGIPAGYEINSFIAACLELAGAGEPIDSDVEKRIKNIEKKVHIQVFVTLTCPYCPSAVMVAHKLAIINPNIIADMIESSTFTPLAIKYNVSSVPKTVINESMEFVGAQPLNTILESIEKL
ncbi:MAG: thioredoxin family protein [Exilispira sp.]|jgi:glutaredoxin-like protein|nr:thioredoxin family protein [Exilispira sp.]